MRKEDNKITKKRRYLLAFVFVTALNLALGIFLLNNSFGQIADKTYKNQSPIVAEIAKQNDSPLRLSVLNVDNSNTSYQVINYMVENVGDKPVRGYVVWAGTDNTGKIIADFFPTKPFQKGGILTDKLIIERENIKSDIRIPFSIDYIEFEDGSSWGEDRQNQSEQIAGGRSGVEAAVDRLKDLFEKREMTELESISQKQLADVEVPLSENVKSKSENWQKGFQNGYKGVISFLKSQQGERPDDTIKKLDEIKKNIQTRRQKL